MGRENFLLKLTHIEGHNCYVIVSNIDGIEEKTSKGTAEKTGGSYTEITVGNYSVKVKESVEAILNQCTPKGVLVKAGL